MGWPSAGGLPSLAGELLERVPGVAVTRVEYLGPAREVVDGVRGRKAVLGRADAQRDRAAPAGAVDPVRLRVGALDGLQPADGAHLGVRETGGVFDVGELVRGLAQEQL